MTTRCKICNLPPEYIKWVEKELRNGLSGRGTIAKELTTRGFTVSESAVKRHKTNHMKEPIPADTPLLGVVAPPVPPTTLPTSKQEAGHFEYDDDGGEISTRAYADDDPEDQELIKDTAKILKDHGIDPDIFVAVGTVGVSRWQIARSDEDSESGFVKTWNTAFKFRFERKVAPGEEDFDLPTLYMQVQDRTPKLPILNNNENTFVVSFSDPQIGKVDERGGTEELLDRIEGVKERLENRLEKKSYKNTIFADAGDIIEGFENTSGQAFGNDRSLMRQVDLAITIEESFTNLIYNYTDHLTVAGVPSNHSAWRKGKGYLGTPADDWGLFSLKQIQKMYDRLEYRDVEFMYPGEYEKTLLIPAGKYNIGLAHGDDARPNKAPEWWGRQMHGGGPVSGAQVLLTGHYHSFLAMVTGGMPGVDGPPRQKWWLQSPTLDNGSSWYRHFSGETSDAGMLVFEMNPETGFVLNSLEIL